MEITERNFSQLSTLQYSFSTCPSPSRDYLEILIVRFWGKCGIGSRGNGDAALMAAIAMAGVEAWLAPALIFDLQKLEYAWGDELTRALSVKPRTFRPEYALLQAPGAFKYPIAVIVSDLNLKGLTSLVKQELRKNPEDILFDTLESALVSVDAQLHSQYGGAEP